MPHPKRGFTRLTATGGNPGNKDAAIRRWIAPADGNYGITGLIRHDRDKGDGIRGRIIHSRQGVLGEWTVHNKDIMARVIKVEVKKGDTIDFILDCMGNASNDNFRWTPTVRRLGMPANMNDGTKTIWSAQSDFAGPPPPPLMPMGQLAQALLMTNEFLYID